MEQIFDCLHICIDNEKTCEPIWELLLFVYRKEQPLAYLTFLECPQHQDEYFFKIF